MLKYIIMLVLFWSFSSKSVSDGYKYKSKDYTRKQKLNNGTIIPPKYTTCLRKKMIAYKGGLACIYQGAGRTFEIEFTDLQTSCPRKYKCVYNPNGQEPNIDDVMKSLRDIAK